MLISIKSDVVPSEVTSLATWNWLSLVIGLVA